MFLVNYIRNEKKVPFACIVAYGDGANYSLGWSKCRKGELFKKERAREIAVGRAMTLGNNEYVDLPFGIAEGMERMEARIRKYLQVENA